ncbi:MAG: Ig-like domain-containing protein [Methanobacterium sp. ERen5]|nr:MAG: Ig-like domain-containing protein [Methanobacterium sp. ERen5]
MNIYNDKKKLFKISLVLVSFVIIFSFGGNTSSAASSSNIYVSTHGNDSWNGLNSTWINGTNGPKATIKSATDAVEDNGTVHIADGTYNENNITLDKSMTIIGQNIDQTIVNGENTHWIFNIANNVNVALENLTLTNGYSSGNGSAILNKGNLTVNDCAFTNNNAYDGGAIYNDHANCTVTDSTFTKNIAANMGGAIYNRYGICNVIDSTFTNNSAGIGGAIINYGGNCSVTGSTFNNNSVGLGGGAIENYGILCDVTGCAFTNNSAKIGGAIDNEAGTCNVTSSNFINNTSKSPTNGGGAICNGFSSCFVDSCNFINNTAQYFGGAVYSDNGTFSLTGSNFTNNTSFWGGAIFNDNGTIILKGSNFLNNTAQYGGAIYDETGYCSVSESTFNFNNAQYYGGAIYDKISTNTVTSCTFTNNTSYSGGAIYSNYCTLNLIGSNFNNNSASYCGALFNYGGNYTIKGSNFTNNSALKSSGGAIINFGTSCIVTDCNFTRNNALLYGGAIANLGPCNVMGSTFIGNVAGSYGSVFYNEGGTADINFCRIVGNALNVTTVYNYNGTTNALYDWWGSNSNPSVYVNEKVDATKWMVLIINPSSSIISKGSKSTVQLTLYYDNLNIFHNPGNGHVPDGTQVIFTGTLGKFSPSSAYLSNGLANSTFTAASGGLATITVKLDNQTLNTNINVTTPTASTNIPGGVYNNTQKIIISMKNAIKIYYTTNGLTPTTASTIYTAPITINSTTTLKYLTVDLAGNKSPVYTQIYTINKIAPKVTSTNPVNNAKGVSLTSGITIKFSEKISKGTNFSKLFIKNMSTGKIVKSTTIINGNTITLKMTMSRLKLNNYQVYIPTGSVKDNAGNNNSRYVLNFKTKY